MGKDQRKEDVSRERSVWVDRDIKGEEIVPIVRISPKCSRKRLPLVAGDSVENDGA